jgi:hypothetical protein
VQQAQQAPEGNKSQRRRQIRKSVSTSASHQALFAQREADEEAAAAIKGRGRGGRGRGTGKAKPGQPDPMQADAVVVC